MSSAIFWLFFISIVAYAFATVTFTATLLTPKRKIPRLGMLFFGTAFTTHLISFLGRFAYFGTLPTFNSLQALQMLVLLFGLIFLIISYRYDVRVLGFLISPFCFVGTLAVLAFDGNTHNSVPVVLQSYWFPIHLATVLLGYALLIMSAVAAFTYLIQERFLRKKRLGSVFRQLPSLHVLDEIAHRMMTIGWVSLSLGMVAGAFYAKLRWHRYWSWDPKQTWTLLTWLFVSGILHMRYIIGWKGRKTMILMAFTALMLLFSMFLLHYVFDSRHGGTYL